MIYKFINPDIFITNFRNNRLYRNTDMVMILITNNVLLIIMMIMTTVVS